MAFAIGGLYLILVIGSTSYSRHRKAQDSKVPKCKICDGVMKMDVVMFGEALENSTLEGAMAAAMTADVVLVVGTSLTVRNYALSYR